MLPWIPSEPVFFQQGYILALLELARGCSELSPIPAAESSRSFPLERAVIGHGTERWANGARLRG